MGLSGVVGLAGWVLVVGCVRRAVREWIGGCEVWVVVCGWCQWVEELGWTWRKWGWSGDWRAKVRVVVRAGRQLGSGA